MLNILTGEALRQYGIPGLFIGILLTMVVLLYKQNNKLHKELTKLQESRVEEAKHWADKHVSIVQQFERSANALSQVVDFLKEVVGDGKRR